MAYYNEGIDMIKPEKEVCQHNKVYAPFVYCSDPPQRPWICSVCGTRGVDVGVYYENKYAELVKQFGG